MVPNAILAVMASLGFQQGTIAIIMAAISAWIYYTCNQFTEWWFSPEIIIARMTWCNFFSTSAWFLIIWYAGDWVWDLLHPDIQRATQKTNVGRAAWFILVLGTAFCSYNAPYATVELMSNLLTERSGVFGATTTAEADATIYTSLKDQIAQTKSVAEDISEKCHGGNPNNRFDSSNPDCVKKLEDALTRLGVFLQLLAGSVIGHSEYETLVQKNDSTCSMETAITWFQRMIRTFQYHCVVIESIRKRILDVETFTNRAKTHGLGDQCIQMVMDTVNINTNDHGLRISKCTSGWFGTDCTTSVQEYAKTQPCVTAVFDMVDDYRKELVANMQESITVFITDCMRLTMKAVSLICTLVLLYQVFVSPKHRLRLELMNDLGAWCTTIMVIIVSVVVVSLLHVSFFTQTWPKTVSELWNVLFMTILNLGISVIYLNICTKPLINLWDQTKPYSWFGCCSRRAKHEFETKTTAFVKMTADGKFGNVQFIKAENGNRMTCTEHDVRNTYMWIEKRLDDIINKYLEAVVVVGHDDTLAWCDNDTQVTVTTSSKELRIISLTNAMTFGDVITASSDADTAGHHLDG